MSKHTAYGMALCLTLFLAILYHEHLLKSVWLVNSDNESSTAKDSIEYQSRCQRQRRSIKEPNCPQYYKATFNDTMFPGHKIELFCDRSKKQTCKFSCIQKLMTPDIPRLTFLGMKMNGDNPVYYYQRTAEKHHAVCLCN